MRQEDLSDRLSKLGHPIASTGITKIENGSRKVTVDDLMALAIALEVTPNYLLLTHQDQGQGALEEPFGGLWLVPKVVGAAKNAWRWACGDMLLRPKILDRKPFTADEAYDWIVENRPHRPPIRFGPKEWQEIDPFVKRFEQLKREVTDAGYDVRALFEEVVFEEQDHDEDTLGQREDES